MRGFRIALLALVAAGVAAFALPAVTLADCGTSASCSQYTDPFGGSSPGTTTHRTTTTTAPPPPASTPAATPPPATTPTVTTPGATVTPTATAATSATTTSSGTSAKTLPYTGYDGGLAALLGAGLVLGGAGLRIRLRRS